MTRARSSAGAPARRARVYQSVRSAHLERFRVLAPAAVFFIDRSYDFETGLVEDLDVVPCRSPWELVRALVRADVDELEINEPLMVPGIKTALLAVLATALACRLRGRRLRVVTYAIENSDPFEHLGARLGRKAPLYRWACAYLVRRTDRLAFGTDMARDTYAPYLRRFRGTETVVHALPEPCPDCDLDTDRGTRVVFVGAFDERKGVRSLLEAWPLLRRHVPDARLHVLGKGPLVELVQDAVDADDSIELTIDPSREQIHAALRSAKVGTLLSVPRKGWREQVGLPIVEALAHGCEVVTTSQTGLAPWLVGHGHRVLDAAPPSAVDVAAALATALADPRGPRAVVASLPARDGRLEADRWMWSSGS
jgi:glycosyltransferase involved in cell wall biosynthesis